MADDKQKSDKTGEVAVEDMIPHPASDWVDWMDRPEPYYEGKPPVYQSELPGALPEQADEQAPDNKPKPDKPA